MSDRLQRAHAAWLEAQAKVAAIVRGADHPGAPADWAEGYRWATRLATIAQEWVVEKNDPLHPVMFLQQDAYRKFIVDNPDLNYHFCVLDDSRAYRLYGNRGEAPYVGLTFGSDIFHWGTGNAPGGTLTQTHLDEFKIAPDGSFEIFIGGSERSGNWIAMAPGTQHLAVRETFVDKRRQRGALLNMELVGEEAPPPLLDPDELADKLELAASFMVFVAETCVAMHVGTRLNMNCFSGGQGAERVEKKEDEVDSHCSTEMAYMGGHWKIAADEALVVTITPPPNDFTYWGLVLVNPWAESFDYRYAQTCTNNRRAQTEADGTWRIVIASRDPGSGNWLDTGGRLEGQMLLRWVLAPNAPVPRCEVVKL